MVLIDKPEDNSLCLPPDRLSDTDRLERLFSGISRRWRLLAILTIDSGPSNLVIPEIRKLIDRYGSSGLATRVVLTGEHDADVVLREARLWNGEDVVATGDNIHARRFLGEASLPSVRLFTPEGTLAKVVTGFDTETGLDPIDEILQISMKNAQNLEETKLAKDRQTAAQTVISESENGDYSVLD